MYLLRVIKCRDNVATGQYYFPVLLADLRRDYCELIKRIIPTLLTNTSLMIGEPGYGKTPVVTTFAFAIVR